MKAARVWASWMGAFAFIGFFAVIVLVASGPFVSGETAPECVSKGVPIANCLELAQSRIDYAEQRATRLGIAVVLAVPVSVLAAVAISLAALTVIMESREESAPPVQDDPRGRS